MKYGKFAAFAALMIAAAPMAASTGRADPVQIAQAGSATAPATGAPTQTAPGAERGERGDRGAGQRMDGDRGGRPGAERAGGDRDSDRGRMGRDMDRGARPDRGDMSRSRVDRDGDRGGRVEREVYRERHMGRHEGWRRRHMGRIYVEGPRCRTIIVKRHFHHRLVIKKIRRCY